MSEHDTEDPKAMSTKERRAVYRETAQNAASRMTELLSHALIHDGERMFREGVLAGLRVQDDGRTTRGEPEDLRRVKPAWCDCATESGAVCSPRRRPADCDTVLAYDDE